MKIVFILLFMFPLALIVNGQVVDSTRIDSIFRKFNRNDCPGCAVAVMNAGNIIFEKGYGMANLEHSIPITSTTVFDVASVSKQFTAFAIALLVKKGKLSLDDNVQKYVPELPEFSKPITIRHLVHHSSGLRDYGALLIMTGWRMDHPVNTTDFINIVSKQKGLNFTPGEKFMYSNTNYGLLGLIIERLSGRSFSDFMKAEVFDPLGMSTTIVRSDPLKIVPHRASNYTFTKEDGYKLNNVWGFSKVMGPSSVHTTLSDLAKWDGNFYHEEVGGKGIRQTMYSPGKLNSGKNSIYAFGLFTGMYRGLHTISHDGAGGGSFVLMRFPDQKLSVAVLCNRYYTQTNSSALAERVADILLSDKFQDNQLIQNPSPVTSKEIPTNAELNKYEGIFWMEGSGNRINFTAQDGRLTTQYNTDTVFPLIYISKGQFFNKAEELVYKFRNEKSGTVSLDITVPGTTELYKAERKPPPHLNSGKLRQYAGFYYNDELDLIWSIYINEDKLKVQRKKFDDQALVPSYLDGFYFTHSDETTSSTYVLNFQRAKDGTINQFTVSAGRFSGVVFRKNKK